MGGEWKGGREGGKDRESENVSERRGGANANTPRKESVLFIGTTHVCHMMMRIHVCHMMMRRIHVSYEEWCLLVQHTLSWGKC